MVDRKRTIRRVLLLAGTLAVAAILLGIASGPPPAGTPASSFAPRAVAASHASGDRAVPSAGPTSPAPAARPSAGPALTVDGVSPSMVSLSWTAAAGLGGSNYAVTESTQGATGPWVTVGNVSTQSPTAFGMTSLAPNASDWWQVTPNGLFSSTSNVVEANQSVLATLSYTLPSSTSAQFNWTNAATYGGLLSFVAYDLYERANGSSPMLVASVASVGTLSYTVTGLTAGAGYSFYLTTVDCLGCGGAAPVQSGTGSNTVTFGTALPLLGSLSAARAAVDVGQPDLFTCDPSGGSSPYTFAWDYGNGTRLAGSGSVSHAYAVAGAATVTCYVKDAAATVASASTSVLVNLP
ncbi:MAG: hypothetical protein L3K05_06765, partial [Thermoplasmata archaeon]|nr:hypothetical protein [Thermoplasmata archaeon]